MKRQAKLVSPSNLSRLQTSGNLSYIAIFFKLLPIILRVWHKLSWEEVAINPTIEPPELTWDWGNRPLEGTNKTCAHQDPGEKSSDPTRGWPGPASEWSGVSGRGVGQAWPATGLGALSAVVHARGLLKEVDVIFSTSTIVWPQVRQQGVNTASPIKRKLD